MAYRGLVLCLVLTLAACTGLPGREVPEAPLVKPPESAAEAIAIAQDLAGRDRWASAMETLASAANRFPDDPTLEEARQTLAARREYYERSLEDQILVDDAENQQRKLAALDRLGRAAPGDLLLTSRRIYWKEVLASKLERLATCAEIHAEAQPALAKRCYTVASELTISDEIERRLNAVAAQLREGESLAAQRRKARAEKERQARAKVLLDEAKVAIDAHDYRRALDVLTQVAELQPGDPEVAGLQQEAWAMISPQVEALVKLGDHLYLDEQLEAAVATWKAALNLKPKDEDILARIERARTVLDRLDVLRKRQQPGAAATSGDS